MLSQAAVANATSIDGLRDCLVPDDTFLDPGAEDYAMTLLDVVVIRHLTGQAETRYRSRDTALIPNQNRMSTCQ